MTAIKMKVLIRLSLVLVSASLFSSVSAQTYEHSVGIRAGYSSGISYKGFLLHRMTAIEADILYNQHGFNLSALGEYHLNAFRSKRFLFYLGGGAFGGSWADEFSIGVTAVAGIEYVSRDLPVIFSVDWRPMLNVYRVFEHDVMDFGISIRYRFKG